MDQEQSNRKRGGSGVISGRAVIPPTVIISAPALSGTPFSGFRAGERRVSTNRAGASPVVSPEPGAIMVPGSSTRTHLGGSPVTRSSGLALALAIFVPTVCLAEEKSDDLAVLKKRVEKLETENAALKKEIADLKDALAALGRLAKAPGAKPVGEDKIKELGKELAEDLVKGRLAAVYQMTSPTFRKTTDRKAFEEQMTKNGGYKVLVATADEKKPTEDFRVKAGQKPTKWYWYYTRTANYGFNTYRVNVAVVFIEDDGEWKIDELDIRRDDS
jgi:hypothetical protein